MSRPASSRARWAVVCTGVLLHLASPAPAQEAPSAPESALQRGARLLDAGEEIEARGALVEALAVPDDHLEAYVSLVQLAIEARDQPVLETLFAGHRAFLFEAPDQFQQRVKHYELRPLRRIYNQAIQAAISRQWKDAERGLISLLGDEAFHRSAAAWLFRLAMQQRDFSRARFLAEATRDAPEDPGTSSDVLAACALQRLDQRQPALGYLIRELGRRGAYQSPGEGRVRSQRSVYLAMIRLHIELDQCFLHGMNNPAEAHPLFPDLPDLVLAYLARR